MEQTTETIASEIVQSIATLVDRLKKTRNAAEIVKRSRLQAGVFDFARFVYNDGKLEVYTSDDDFSEADLEMEVTRLTGPVTVGDITRMLAAELQPILAAYDNDPILDYRFRVYGRLLIGSGKLELPPVAHTSPSKKQRLLEEMQQYMENKVFKGQYPTKELDTFFFANHLLDAELMGNIQVTQVKNVFNKILELNKGNRETLSQHRHHIIHALRTWAERKFLPAFYDIDTHPYRSPAYTLKAERPAPDPGLLDLLLYTGVMIIRHEPNYSRPTGVQFTELAGQLGLAQAAGWLKNGSGKYESMKEDGITAKANDILGIVEIQVQEENAGAYERGLQYLVSVLEHEFPASYEIKLKSKVKTFLPLKNLGKTDTHRFFANALQYPALFPLLERYARIAMAAEFEWYTDAEAESCALPGTYAVFGLGLASEAYFPLVRDYMMQVDTEHQSIQNHFTTAFVARYGVTANTIPTLVACLYACQDMKPLKELAPLQTPEFLPLLLQELQELPGYEVERLVSFIWGSKDKLTAAAKKKGAADQLLQLLTLMAKR
jgi:hypothetical protein